MDRKNSSLGLILIALGFLFLANQIFDLRLFTMSTLWPIFILAPGLVFEFSYFMTGRNPGLLVPGGILSTIGLLFFFETLTRWHFAAYTWPVYILAPAVGLFQLYVFGGRQKGLLIPVAILSTIAGVSFAVILLGTVLYWLNYSMIVPAVLIVLGIIIISGNRDRR
ncbi:MAG: DUF5668 domain-containing protein [Clostridia bacterium]|nr:DUF5668 domain-containing protein [Clostridia bacterium]